MFTKLPLVAAAAVLLAACDADNPIMTFEEPANFQLAGTWVGVEEITSAQDIGSNVNFGDQDRGNSFPVTLHLRVDGTFDLITAGYPTSFDDENLRTCVGSWSRNGTNIQFFALRACRVLPLPVYVIGRNLGRSVTFEATTGTTLFPSAASIKVRFNLNR